MAAAVSGFKVTIRVECPACFARYDQMLYRRPRGLFLPPSQCGACGTLAVQHAETTGCAVDDLLITPNQGE